MAPNNRKKDMAVGTFIPPSPAAPPDDPSDMPPGARTLIPPRRRFRSTLLSSNDNPLDRPPERPRLPMRPPNDETIASRPMESRPEPGGRPNDLVTALADMARSIQQGFQAQTDRVIAELQQRGQTPAAGVAISSAERIGVFVDVANLNASARDVRSTVNFGKLLSLVTAGRRQVRAQAYCATGPEPDAEQALLAQVKGHGYRVTTRGARSFANGMRKSNLGIDLCMDVVRLVDARAVDCICLLSGDGDLLPLLTYCADRGVRVEVAAFEENLPETLRATCDRFINLSLLPDARIPDDNTPTA